MPPVALMSAAAWSAPFFICAPVAALGPVIGPPTPNLIWAVAVPAVTIAMLKATASVVTFFISRSPSNWSQRFVPSNITSERLTAPAHRAVGFIKPAILFDHLCSAGGPEAEEPEPDTERTVDQIVVKRQKTAAEQTVMKEPHGPAQDESISENLPAWPPG